MSGTPNDTAQDLIDRAIALIDTAGPADLTAILAQTSIHDHLKADPAALRANLADDSHPFISRRLAAQSILAAASDLKDARMSDNPNPAHLAPLDGAHLSAMQADLIMTMLAGFRPFSDRDAATADGLKAQLGDALGAFDKAHADG